MSQTTEKKSAVEKCDSLQVDTLFPPLLTADQGRETPMYQRNVSGLQNVSGGPWFSVILLISHAATLLERIVTFDLLQTGSAQI